MNDSRGVPTTGLRALTRDAVRANVAATALVMFGENGFDQTTVEDIVTAVGISPRSFFRYFPSKEDVVIGDLVMAGTELRDNVARRLADQTAWEALRGAMRDVADQIDADPSRWQRVMRVINSAASLRARNLEKHLTWSALLIPVITEHTDTAPQLADLSARTLVGTAFACLDAALTSWTEAEGEIPFGDVLEAAFDTVGAERSR